MMKSNLLSRNLSIYLDLMRLICAFSVFIDHSNGYFFHIRHSIILSQGRQAVAFFFVLSGFVIAFVTSKKESDWRVYLLARSSRLYSVALPAIALTILLDFIGSHINSDHYASLGIALHTHPSDGVGAILTYLTFTNQLWFSHVVLGSDEPYWSLGFEAWYYVFFALACFLPRKASFIAIFLWFLFCGPKIAMYLPLWLLGVLAYRNLPDRSSVMDKSKSLAIFIASMLGYLIVIVIGTRSVTNMYDTFGFIQEFKNFLFFLSLGFVVYLNILSFDNLFDGKAIWSPAAERWIRWMAGASFTMYLAHEPILIFISCVMPATQHSILMGCAGCVIALTAVLALAEIGERRKSAFSHVFRRVIF